MVLLIQYTLLYASDLQLVALGGCFSEHSGVINLGLEGIMVMGALGGALMMRYLPDGKRQIGHEAVEHLESDARNTITSVKRFMGRGLGDVQDAGKLPYDLVAPGAPSPGMGMVSLDTAGGVKSPVEVSADILATLRYRAEDTFIDDLYGAVITVPA